MSLTTFNLIYHLCPMGSWRENVALLKPHLPLFNGKRIVAVVQGPGLDDIREVQKLLPDVTCAQFKNNSELGETVTFYQMLKAVHSLDESEATFYGHGKGVSYGVAPTFVLPASKQNLSQEKKEELAKKAAKAFSEKKQAIKIWTKALHHHLLGRFEEVKVALEEKPVVGAYLRYGTFPQFPPETRWHFAGSFHWFRNKDLFQQKDWDKVPKVRHGAEAYPGLRFTASEAHSMFIKNSGNPYDLKYQKRINKIR